MLVFADTKNINIQSATLDLDKEKKKPVSTRI
jgi:hypothetical protein